MSTIVKYVDKKFGDFQALYDINLEIADGEFVAILGPSGCGKTTLLRLLAGFDKPSQGEIIINGQQVSNQKHALSPDERNVAMVFQGFALWPHLNVRQHIEFPLIHDRFAPKEYKRNPDQRINQVLDIINLSDKGFSMPGELSGGQKQRVALGRAIAPEPKLLLMDEPLSALDAELRIEMRREIQSLHRLTNSSIVYVTHDQGEALAMSDRIVVMNMGHIEQIGTPEEIYYHPETKFVANFVGKANLFEGKWENNQFLPSQSNIVWPDFGTSESLKAANLYALRPEQISLSEEITDKLAGKILTKQFQGKEYHYSIELGDKELIVQTPYSQSFEIGQEVGITPIKEVI